MPNYDTKVVYGVKKGEVYEIISADSVNTRTGIEGIKVEMKARDVNDKRVYGETLWPSEQTSATSKFGCFVSALGSNTDNWLHKWIYVVEWQNHLCIVNLVPAPKMSLSQSAKRISTGEAKE